MDDNVQSKHDGFGIKMFFSALWFVSLLIAGFIGFVWGQGSKIDESKNVLTANTSEVPATVSPSPSEVSNNNVPDSGANTPTPTINTSTCSKNGFAQKWEYLTAYVIKENDSIQKIAKEQLKDETRVNEILQINGVGPLVVGSTLYLPPSTITKSSGNIKQLYGKLMEKNTTSWHVSFSSDPKGQGILIPSFLFEGIENKDSYKPGDCIKVFLDDGFTVYSVSLQ
jgi:hypothetical protein